MPFFASALRTAASAHDLSRCNRCDFTLPVALMNAQSGPMNTVDWGALQAGITVMMLPCVVLFILLQRYYVSGLVSGSVK